MSHRFDEITIEQLRAHGGKKWVQYPGTIGAWIAETDFGTAPVVAEAVTASLAGAGIGYVPDSLRSSVQEAFTRFATDRWGWELDPADVRSASDVMAAFAATVRIFSPGGAPIILPTPAYMPFLTIPPALERELLQVPMVLDGDRYVYDLDALDAAFAAGGHVMVLCNPHNPVGRVLERSELEAIAEVVDRHGGRVFADEIHAPLVYAPHRHIPYASISEVTAGHTITATSASKAFNIPGLKCAQVILSNDADRQAWRVPGKWVEDQTATVGLIAADAAFRDGGPWLAEVLGYLEHNRRTLAELVAEHLPGVGYREPEGTYLAWLRTADVIDQAERAFRTDAEVVLTPGRLCGAGAEGYVRLNFATPTPILAEVVTRIAAVVAGAAAGGRRLEV